MNCKTCGAGQDANYLTCQFCGAATVTLDADQELRAINELADTARRIASEKMTSGLAGNMMENLMAQSGAIEGASKNERIAQLWTSAFIPLTFEAQFQALTQVAGTITTAGRSDHAGKHLANEALIRRGETLVATMNATTSQDPTLAARAAAISTQFQQTKTKAEKFEQAGRNKAKAMIFVVAGIVILMLVGVASILIFGDSKHLDDKCRGEKWTNCENTCQIAACSELCSDGTNWACVALESLGQGNKQGFNPPPLEIQRSRPRLTPPPGTR
jgi:hypothetical protein